MGDGPCKQESAMKLGRVVALYVLVAVLVLGGAGALLVVVAGDVLRSDQESP